MKTYGYHYKKDYIFEH